MYKDIDKDNMYNSIWNFPDNLIDATGIGDNIILKNSYDNIEKVIVAGMGGAAIGGDVVAILGKEKLKTPFFVITGYIPTKLRIKKKCMVNEKSIPIEKRNFIIMF